VAVWVQQAKVGVQLLAVITCQLSADTVAGSQQGTCVWGGGESAMAVLCSRCICCRLPRGHSRLKLQMGSLCHT
jgi:hypothetical protein